MGLQFGGDNGLVNSTEVDAQLVVLDGGDIVPE